MHFFFSILIFLMNFLPSSIFAASESPLLEEEKRKQEGIQLYERCLELAKFYELPAGVDLWEITDDLFISPYVSDASKQSMRKFDRRIFVFTYPSDGLQIKGLISFVPYPEQQPLLVFLRGGNRLFGILNPASDFMCAQQYTVISTTYRGGVSEGEDEFGGEDVNDVKNLIDFLPKLEQKLHLSLHNEKIYLLGGSRGGMQMFLALARFPELQKQMTKVVSLSGLLDMQQCIAERSDMKEMFIKDFGLVEGVNEDEWIERRNPLVAAVHIQKDIPILIIQGTLDNRVGLEEGYHMVSQLHDKGQQFVYLEVGGGDHCLSNMEDRVQLILDWLEE